MAGGSCCLYLHARRALPQTLRISLMVFGVLAANECEQSFAKAGDRAAKMQVRSNRQVLSFVFAFS